MATYGQVDDQLAQIFCSRVAKALVKQLNFKQPKGWKPYVPPPRLTSTITAVEVVRNVLEYEREVTKALLEYSALHLTRHNVGTIDGTTWVPAKEILEDYHECNIGWFSMIWRLLVPLASHRLCNAPLKDLSEEELSEIRDALAHLLCYKLTIEGGAHLLHTLNVWITPSNRH